MKLLPFLVLPLLLAACASARAPYNPVDNVRYSAIGADPYWQVTIGDDRIVLRVAADPGTALRPYEQVWSRTLPRTQNGITTWQSGEGASGIAIESRPGPCGAEDGPTWRDSVTVLVGERQLSGCGGPLLGGEER